MVEDNRPDRFKSRVALRAVENVCNVLVGLTGGGSTDDGFILRGAIGPEVMHQVALTRFGFEKFLVDVDAFTRLVVDLVDFVIQEWGFLHTRLETEKAEMFW